MHDETSNRWRSGGATVRAFALVASLIAALVLLAAPRAAADYNVVQCALGGQQPVNYSEAAWTPFGSTGFSIWGTNECRPGGTGLRLDTTYNGQGTGYTGNGSGLAWRFTSPPGTTFESASATVHFGVDGGFGAVAFSDAPNGFQPLNVGPNPADSWDVPTAANVHLFEVRLQCFRSPNCHSTWAYAWTTAFVAAVRDSSLPTVAGRGPLLNGGVVRGNQTLHVDSEDVGGGVRAIRLYVNGVLSRVDEGWCQPDYQDSRYTHLQPCPASVSREIPVDTQHDPGWTNGPNDLIVCSADAGIPGPGGENVSSPCFRRTIQVDNSCPGSGGTAAADLEAGADLGGRLTDRAAITSNDAPVVRGTLKDGAGNSVPGATVCLYQTIDLPDASRELVTSVTTQGNGRFATRLDAGPSRDLDVIYRHNDSILADHVDLDSAAVPTLALTEKSLRNGDAAHFTGRLPGPNADGRAVALQAHVGRKWRTFKQLRTDADGRFKGKYRFTQTVGRVRYIFRVLLKRQSGYPYEPGASRKRKLVVQG